MSDAEVAFLTSVAKHVTEHGGGCQPTMRLEPGRLNEDGEIIP